MHKHQSYNSGYSILHSTAMTSNEEACAKLIH